jgi:hypothetical protein
MVSIATFPGQSSMHPHRLRQLAILRHPPAWSASSPGARFNVVIEGDCVGPLAEFVTGFIFSDTLQARISLTVAMGLDTIELGNWRTGDAPNRNHRYRTKHAASVRRVPSCYPELN